MTMLGSRIGLSERPLYDSSVLCAGTPDHSPCHSPQRTLSFVPHTRARGLRIQQLVSRGRLDEIGGHGLYYGVWEAPPLRSRPSLCYGPNLTLLRGRFTCRPWHWHANLSAARRPFFRLFSLPRCMFYRLHQFYQASAPIPLP